MKVVRKAAEMSLEATFESAVRDRDIPGAVLVASNAEGKIDSLIEDRDAADSDMLHRGFLL